MTAFVVDLTQADERVLIGADSLIYTVAGRHVPIGFRNKVIPFPHVPGAMFGAGIDEITIRAAAAVMKRTGESATAEQVVDALPAILRHETEAFARRRGIHKPERLAIVAVAWCGFNAASKQFEMVAFSNEDDFAPQRGFSGFIGLPNVPPAYLPSNFGKLEEEARIIAALRSIRRFTEDHGNTLGMPPIGGEIVLTDIDRDRVWNGVIGNFGDLENAQREIEEIRARLADLPAGHDLLNAVADRPAALKRLEQALRGGAPAPSIAPVTLPGLSRQQRRAAEKAAHKAARRAA